MGKHSAGALGKVAFGLTSFMLRQSNMARSNIYYEWKAGRQANAIQYAGRYMVYMGMASMMMSAIKDFVAGNDISTSKQFLNTMLQMVGLNRVALGQVEKGHVMEAVGERVLPGISGPVGDLGHDTLLALNKLVGGNKYSSNEGYKLPRRVPLVGSPYYNLMGGGKAKADAAARTRQPEKTDYENFKESILGTDNRRATR